jgi:signal transduction histidine kinase/streptogramin lyase
MRRSSRPSSQPWLIVLLAASSLFAAPTHHFGYQVWTAEHGLPQNVIRGIYQTSDGYLWLATLNGAARFDGAQFTVFDKNNTPGIGSNRLASLYGNNDDLWFSTEGGGLTRYHGGQFHTYTTKDGLPTLFPRAVTGDSSGNIWVLVADRILRWDEASNRFQEITLPYPKLRYDMFWWERGGFWGADKEGLHCFIRGKFYLYPLPAWLSPGSLLSAARDESGAIWLETRNGMQARIDTSDAREAAIRITAANAKTVRRDGKGREWNLDVGTELIRRLSHPRGGAIETIPFSVWFEDREGNLWLGTEGRGLYQVRPQFISSYSVEQGLVDRNVYPICEGRDGSVWIGAWRKGLSRYQNGKFTNYGVRDGLSASLITALAVDRDDRVWVGAGEELRLVTAGRISTPRGLRLPARATVQAILPDRDGVLWMGTTRGLLRYEKGAATFYTAADGLAANDVRVLVEGRNGDLWIAGYGGLTLRRGGSFTRWTTNEGLPGATIRSVYQDSDGVVWIGTYDEGLTRMEGGKFTHYTTRSGLHDNGVFQILEDDRHNLWMSCNRGIYRVSKPELNEFARGARTTVASIAYGKVDGMSNVECNGAYWPAGIRARDGKLWFPTQDGVTVVDTGALPGNPQPPPVMIESVRVDNRSLPLDRPLRLDPSNRSFEIQYTALSFINSQQIRFRCRLQDLDPEWQDVGTRRTVYYSHVPAGRYQFRVTARNSDGVWNPEARDLSIEVLAPFYETRSFQFLAVVAVAGIIALAWRYRVAQFRRMEALQHAFSGQLIASQENERKRIAAELHDSLGQRLVIVKSLALFFLRDHQSSASAPTDLKSIEEISEEVTQAINETREIAYNLRPFRLDRVGLTKATAGLVQSVAAASGIEMTADLDPIDDVFADDLRINFYRIVQESLGNVVKHSLASRVEVTVRRSEWHVVLTISDDGRGFTPGAAKPETGKSGFGLTGMAERASLLGGVFEVRSAVGRGTVVTVTFNMEASKHG